MKRLLPYRTAASPKGSRRMKKTITALLSAAFIAALLVPTLAATKPMPKNMDMKKRRHVQIDGQGRPQGQAPL